MVRKGVPAIERFLTKIDINPWGFGCWIWTAKTAGTKSTYGQFSYKSKYVYAHRFIWEYINGPIPEGMELDHLCRNSLCVNPFHLEPVTPDENSKRARKTVCINGHDLRNPRNQATDTKGRRRGCAECNRVRVREAYRTKHSKINH